MNLLKILVKNEEKKYKINLFSSIFTYCWQFYPGWGVAVLLQDKHFVPYVGALRVYSTKYIEPFFFDERWRK